VAPDDGDSAHATWVLLHGSDGRETDLLPLADRLGPGAAAIAPRGTVRTAHGFAHFRRRPDRTIDHDDVRRRVPLLADAVESATASLPGSARRTIVGFSNGAVMAAALVETRPDLFTTGILIRPQPPFGDARAPAGRAPAELAMPVLVLDGRFDPRRHADDGLRVAERLRSLGAAVDHVTLPVGHGITDADEQAVRRWLHAASGSLR